MQLKSQNFLEDLMRLLYIWKMQKKQGENIFVNFNGNKLYALLDDRDSCYEKVTGYKYDEFQEVSKAERRAFEERQIKERLEAIDKLDARIESGLKYIYPQREFDWKKRVMDSTDGIYLGNDIDSAIEIMEILANSKEENKFDIAMNKLDEQGHSNISYWVTLGSITTFAKEGVNFFKYLMEKQGKTIAEQDIDYLNKLESENASFEAELEGAERE